MCSLHAGPLLCKQVTNERTQLANYNNLNWMKISKVNLIILLKAFGQYFPVVLFILLNDVVLTFESVDVILKYGHSKKATELCFPAVLYVLRRVRLCHLLSWDEDGLLNEKGFYCYMYVNIFVFPIWGCFHFKNSLIIHKPIDLSNDRAVTLYR